MERIALRGHKPITWPSLFILLLCSLLIVVYYGLYAPAPVASSTLTSRLQRTIAIPATDAIYSEAIRQAAKTLAERLDIELENYDLSEAEYQDLVDAAAEKFGHCEQYRLYSITGGWYDCYSCQSKPRIELLARQTYRIGQTCGEQKTRYGQGLPEPGLFYLIEFRGNIFEVFGRRTR